MMSIRYLYFDHTMLILFWSICGLSLDNVTSLTQGAPGNLNKSSEYIGRTAVPRTGVVSQRYPKPVEHDGIVIESDFLRYVTLPSGS